MKKENENDEKERKSTSVQDGMTGLLSSYPWQHTPLGSISSWHENLISLINLLEVIPQPGFILVGPELNLVCNKFIVQYLGRKNPNALGMPFFTVFPGLKESLSIPFNEVIKGGKREVKDVPLPGLSEQDQKADLLLIPIMNDNTVEWIIGLIDLSANPPDKNLLNALKQKGPGVREELIALKELHLMTSSVLQAGSLNEALNLILNSMVRILKADFGSIILVNEDTKDHEIVAHVGFGPEFLQAFKNKDISACSASGKALKHSYRVVIDNVNTDESYIPFRANALEAGYQSEQASPLINRKGKIIGVLSTHHKKPHTLGERSMMFLDIMTLQITDIIEHFQREEKLRVTQQHEMNLIKTENKQKDEFIDIAGHELKVPLTSLSAYLQILRDEDFSLDQGTAKRYLKKTENSVNRLSNLILHLLEMSRIKAGSIKYNFTDFDILEMILESIENAKFQSSKHVIMLSENISCVITGDKDRLQQVIDNYLTNAIKYSPLGGKIIVSIKKLNGMVEVSVSDEGLGVPDNMLQDIFKPYYRAKMEGNNKVTGLGLGLYISSEIVKGHNGKCWVESIQGVGSVFYFSIPVHANIDHVG